MSSSYNPKKALSNLLKESIMTSQILKNISMNKWLILSALFWININTSFSQFSTEQYIKAAKDAMENGNYYGALKNYSEALKGKENDEELLYNLGFAAYKQGAYAKSVESFTQYIENHDGDMRSDAMYYLANSQMMMGDYDNAELNFNNYVSEYGDINPVKTLKAKESLKSASWAKEQPQDRDDLDVKNLAAINTNYSEHAPILLNDKLYFSSLRYPYGSKKTETLGSKILIDSTGSAEELAAFEMFNADKELTSNPTFSPDGETMFYSLCEYVQNEDIECKLFSAKRTAEGVYTNATKLPAIINVDGKTSSMPSIKTNDEGMWLYYSTNREGGRGGMDIWSSKFDDQMNFQTPENSHVNTVGDDITPFYHHASETLYFSSNGRVGFGGFDVYKDGREGIENMGSGYNSSYNDQFFTLTEDESIAHLSSNREGGKMLDGEVQACCYDIYRIDAQTMELDLLALIYDEKTGEPILGARVVLKDLITGEIIFDSENMEGNDYTAKIRCDRKYELTVYKDGYEDSSKIIGPYTDKCGEGKVEEKVYLKSKQQIIVEKAKESLKGVIPVRLFFENDHPNPKTTQITTNLTYTETYNKYYPKKPEYGNKYANSVGASGKDQVEAFFEAEVRQEYENFLQMMPKLLLVLEDGQQVNLYIRGYASPIAASAYNAKLGNRRVDSARNELKRFQGGVLTPYLNSGQLTFTERSFGETTAPTGISDDAGNRSKSVYSPEASRERRVEIDEINFGGN